MPRNTPRKTFSIQLETDLIDRIDALAKQELRSRGGQIRWLMLRALEQCDLGSRPETRTPASSEADATAAA